MFGDLDEIPYISIRMIFVLLFMNAEERINAQFRNIYNAILPRE